MNYLTNGDVLNLWEFNTKHWRDKNHNFINIMRLDKRKRFHLLVNCKQIPSLRSASPWLGILHSFKVLITSNVLLALSFPLSMIIAVSKTPGRYSPKFYTRRLRSEVQPFTLLCNAFDREETPLVYSFHWQMVPFSHNLFRTLRPL